MTRDSVLQFASDLGYNVKEEHISYSSIGNFDEAFFTGTAIGIVPIKQIDNLIFNSIEIGKSLQKYYLDMLPHHLTKELKWFDLIDVEKDYQEQFSDIITPILNLDRNLVDFVKTDLLKLMSLGFNFIYDDVVKTMWDKHIAERGEYIDFITKQVKLSYNPSGLNKHF
jgi:hypothetical protein